ncbi:MAG: gamma-glutamylcyclotransferase, partial [Pseudomonadota bacterium]
VLHYCDENDLAALDQVEAYGIGYDRIDVDLETSIGLERGLAYMGLPRYVNQECLPTRRYLNILVRGAIAAKIDRAYIDKLQNHPVLEPLDLQPFEPAATKTTFCSSDLEPPLTVLAGHVFDMSNARAAHDIPKDWFGGKDVTVFHLRRMDSSDGTENLENVIDDRLSTGQRVYLNRYLHAFDEEYDYVGRFDYASLPPEKQFGSTG